MTKTLATLAPETLGVTRLLAGMLFAWHSAQQLTGAFGGPSTGTPPLIQSVAGLIKLVGGTLLAAGLFTRAVAFVAAA